MLVGRCKGRKWIEMGCEGEAGPGAGYLTQAGGSSSLEPPVYGMDILHGLPKVSIHTQMGMRGRGSSLVESLVGGNRHEWARWAKVWASH